MPFKYNPFTGKLDYTPSREEIEGIIREVAAEGVQYSERDTFADLPDPLENVGKICIVLNRSINGAYPFVHRKGPYHSIGTSWKRLGKALTLAELSNPPVGMHRITNFFWNPETQKMVVDFDDNPRQ